MNATQTLKGSHLRTYNTIFQHPISHNLEWRAVRALLEQIGQIVEEPNGHLKATRNGQTLILHKPHTKDLAEDQDVMALRHFLKQSDAVPPEPDAKILHWLLVIDHHEARILRAEIRGTHPERILPHDGRAYFNHARDSEEISRGKEKPALNTFFEPIAKALEAVGQIVVFGAGTGASSEMEQFITWLHSHHPDTARRVIAALTVNEMHLTDDQLLAKARDFFQNAALSEPVKR